MPQLPSPPIGEYQQQTTIADPFRRITPHEEPGIAAEVGQGIATAGEKYEHQEGLRYSLQALTGLQSGALQNLETAKQSAKPGAPNFTADVMSQFDKDAARAVENSPNDTARTFLNDRLVSLRGEQIARAMSFEAVQRTAHDQNLVFQHFDAAGNELLAHPEVFPQRLAESRALINQMVVSPEKREEWNTMAQGQLAKATVVGRIQRDPYGTYSELVSPNPKSAEIQALSPAERVTLLSHADSMLHQRIADARETQTMANEQQRRNSDALLKQGILMHEQGGLTPQWIEKFHSVWEPQAYEYLYRLQSGKGGETDPRTYVDLTQRVGRGENVSQPAADALFAGRLQLSDYKQFANIADKGMPSPMKLGADVIDDRLKPGIAEKYDPVQHQRHSDAVQDYWEWALAHPNATAHDSMTQAKQIAHDHAFINFGETKLTLPMPRYMTGTRVKPDLDSAAQRTFQAEQRGEIPHAEAAAQMQLIARWRAAQERADEAAAKTKAANP